MLTSFCTVRRLAGAVFGAITALPCHGHAQDARELARRAFRSVVLITTTDASGQPLALGSGFFVSDSLVVTNAHVVRGAAGANAKLVGAAPHAKVAGLAGVDLQHDLALLVVGGLNAAALPLSRGVSAEVGDRVYAIGNPRGLKAHFRGELSAESAPKRRTLLCRSRRPSRPAVAVDR